MKAQSELFSLINAFFFLVITQITFSDSWVKGTFMPMVWTWRWYFLNSVSHTKASLIGPSISIPITDGRLNFGTWQGADTTSRTCDPSLIRFYLYHLLGIYLTEFRHAAHARRVIATIL